MTEKIENKGLAENSITVRRTDLINKQGYHTEEIEIRVLEKEMELINERYTEKQRRFFYTNVPIEAVIMAFEKVGYKISKAVE